MPDIVRNWWPIPTTVAVVVAVQIWWSGRYEVPGGHASGHFMNASAIFGFSVAITLLLWALPRDERRQPAVWLLCVAVLAGALAVTIANVWIVDAIGPNDWSNAQADALGPMRPGFTSGHDLDSRANLAMTGAGIGLAAWLGWRRAVNRAVAGVAAAISVIGGLGVFVLAIAVIVRRAAQIRAGRATDDRRGVEVTGDI